MTDYRQLAELLFSDIDKTPDYYEALYPPRALPEGARVSRFSPSPTGYLHFGGLYAATASRLNAKTTGGVFYLRIEDTDKKREVEGGVEAIVDGLNYFGLTVDEGVTGADEEIGAYAPYTQSKRADIYRTYAKSLVEQGLAYPCFCTAQELEEIRAQQENESIKGYWGKYARYRDCPIEEIRQRLENGEEWTLRLKSPGNPDGKITFDDLIRGRIEMQENVIDVVLLKADGIPTYHFAHAVDDHLMRTTHVVRGDEWIASVPLHLQLFRVLGFRPVKYAHIAPIMKEENGGKRKLSKRKDPEAAVSYYAEQGFPQESVSEYIMTILNSNFEDWRRANREAPLSDFPFNIKKMSVSGALFDMAKLTDVSKNVISTMTADEVCERSYNWACEYNRELADLYEQDIRYAKAVLGIDRGNSKPRKDIAKWSDIPDYISYMYDSTFKPCYELTGNATKTLAVMVLEKYIEIFDINDDKDAWFERIKALCEPCGCTPNVKEYKQNPDAYKGHVGDVSTCIRVALTGRTNTPDLYSITSLLGEDTVRERLQAAIDYYKETK